MKDPLKAPQLNEDDQVQFHNQSMVCAQEHYHDFAQIQESQPLPSLCHSKDTEAGLHT